MNTMSQMLFWITNGMLIPVIAFLTIMFVGALVSLGGFFGTYFQRTKHRKTMKSIEADLVTENPREYDVSGLLEPNDSLRGPVQRMLACQWHPVHSEKVIADFQDHLERSWIEELRAKYGFEVNREALHAIR